MAFLSRLSFFHATQSSEVLGGLVLILGLKLNETSKKSLI